MIKAEARERLIEEAQAAIRDAYAPYSNYPVGAALLADNGKIYKGVNVENAVYPLTICAERSAVVSAVSDGARKFQAIAVVTRDGGTPCGSCRQVLAEFGLDIEVILLDTGGKEHQTTTVGELLPYSFGPENLKSTG